MKLGFAVAALGLAAVSAFAAESVESGLKPGTPATPFQVVDVSGPNKGRELCYRSAYGGAPVVAAFVNGDASKAAGLVAHIQQMVETRKAQHLRAFVVVMAGPESKNAIQSMTSERKITIPVTFLPKGTGESDIGAYKINPSAKNTILLWRGQTVKQNIVNVDQDTFPQLEKAVDELVR